MLPYVKTLISQHLEYSLGKREKPEVAVLRWTPQHDLYQVKDKAVSPTQSHVPPSISVESKANKNPNLKLKKMVLCSNF